MPNSLQIILRKHERAIGITASALAVLMFFSLLEVFMSNLRGESNILIQPAATALNGLAWSLYGYSKKDLFILIPNLTGLVLGVLTVISALI